MVAVDRVPGRNKNIQADSFDCGNGRALQILNSAHIDELLSGRILMRTAEYYRTVPFPWGDELENLSRTYVRRIDDTTRQLLPNTVAGGGPIPPPLGSPEPGGGSTVIIDSTFETTGAPGIGHIFCASWGDLGMLTTAVCDNPADPSPYDACIQIRAPEMFAQSVMDEGILLPSRTPLRKTYSGRKLDRVKYCAVASEVEQGPRPEPSVFIKDLSYKSQQGARLVLIAHEQVTEDTVYIEFPNPERYLFEKFRNRPSKKQILSEPPVRLTYPRPRPGGWVQRFENDRSKI